MILGIKAGSVPPSSFPCSGNPTPLLRCLPSRPSYWRVTPLGGLSIGGYFGIAKSEDNVSLESLILRGHFPAV